MAYLTVNSTFNPYTFDELVKPFVMYDTAYQQEVARTNELLEKAAALEDLSPTLDKEAYDSYQNWKGQLKAISDQIAETGLDINTRRAITGLGNTYRTDYLPYTEKLKTRGALIKEQREYLQKHPNAFFDIDYSATPVGDISTASSYNTYDLDDITTKVMTDAYGKLANGESVDASKYLEQYGAGLEDAGRLSQVAQAINSGISIASANQKQKEFENYIKEITAKRTYARSGGGGGSYSNTTKHDDYLHLPTGDVVAIKYNKKTGQYEYHDKTGKSMYTFKDMQDISQDELLKNYYGGHYGVITVGNKKIERIISDNGYAIKDKNNKWIGLENRGDTIYDDFLNAYNGRKEGNEIHMYSDEELSSSEEKWNRKFETNKKRYEKREIPIDRIGELIGVSPKMNDTVRRLKELRSIGAIGGGTVFTYYIDNRTDNMDPVVFYKTSLERFKDRAGNDMRGGSPIEGDWETTLEALKVAEQNDLTE